MSNTHPLDEQAEAYVRLVLALGERDPDSIDFFTGPGEWRDAAHAAYAPLADIRRSAQRLVAEIAGVTRLPPAGRARQQFLTDQLEAVIARVVLLSGSRTSFDEESRSLFGVDVPGITRSRFDAVRADLERLLPGSGTLAHRYAAFDRRFIVPRGRVPAVIARALEGCREVARQHLALPADERTEVEYVGNMPWSAFTRYEGRHRSRIRINPDFDLTVDRALQLACHEGYPGHHLINTLMDVERVERDRLVEFTALPLFSPLAFRIEGAATFAPELAFPGDERVQFERDELYPLAGLDPAEAASAVEVARLVERLAPLQLDIARQYLDGELEFVRAATALEEEALMPSPEATLKFLNEFRTYVVTYTLGRDLVAARMGTPASAADVTKRWQAYRRWVLEVEPPVH